MWCHTADALWTKSCSPEAFMKPACSVLVLMFVTILVLPTPSRADTFIVSNEADSTEIHSLRGALLAASVKEGRHSILVKEGTYFLSQRTTNSPPGLGGALSITNGHLSIVGLNSNVTISAAGSYDRVFEVLHGADVRLSRVTITGGITLVGTNGVNKDGAGIYNAGRLELDHCTVTSNLCTVHNPDFENWQVGGNGGGIFNSGLLVLNHCDIVDNSSGDNVLRDGGDGGGIYNKGVLSLHGCNIVSNKCGSATTEGFIVVGWPPPRPRGGGNGGGIYNTGDIFASACTMQANTAGVGDLRVDGGPGGKGGGICNLGRCFATASTIYENYGGLGKNGGDGGGLDNEGTAMLTRSTISGNKAGNGNPGSSTVASYFASGNGGNGGGVCNTGKLVIRACTIAGNFAGTGGDGGLSGFAGGNGGNGGGLFNAASNSPARLRNTLIGQNVAGNGGAGGTNFSGVTVAPGLAGDSPDVAGIVLSEKFNLIGISQGSSGLDNGINGDLVGTITTPIDPRLDALQMNGGLTPTHALLPDSPAIDQGDSFGTHVDQRGHHRPYIHESVTRPSHGDGSDIGSFERDNR